MEGNPVSMQWISLMIETLQIVTTVTRNNFQFTENLILLLPFVSGKHSGPAQDNGV